jgi:hypothetical protein
MNTATHVDFCVKGATLQVSFITELLGMHATNGFNPSERYIGKARIGDSIVAVERTRPSFGVWHFSTEGQVISDFVEDHARYLLAVLTSSKAGIQELVQSPDYEVVLSIWCVSPNGFDIASETMALLTAVCQRITVRCLAADESAV